MALKTAVNANGIVVQTAIKLDQYKLAQMKPRALEGLFALGYDIAAQARRNAPVVTGALRNSIRLEEDGETIYIRAGGTVINNKRIDYAMKREQGPNRNPATEHYMANAQRAIMTGDYLTKYFGDILQ